MQDGLSEYDANKKALEFISNDIPKIIKKGTIIDENGVKTIWYKENEEYYLVGLSKGFHGKGDNVWIITVYKKTKGRIPDETK